MRKLPAMEAVWRSGQFLGEERRPFARVTVQRPKMALRNYSLMSTFRSVTAASSGTNSILTPALPLTIDPYHGRKVSQTYADFMFTPPEAPKELPNIRSVAWSRALNQDLATLTLEIYNTAPRDEDVPLPSGGRIALDHPGYYTYNRGKTAGSKRWGHTINEWSGLIMPDNLLRTYEGYGYDQTKAPEFDTHLAHTGVWLIDTVQLNAFGIIVISARDVGRLLVDHQINAPVIPQDFLPLIFEPWGKVPGTPQRTRIKAKVADHSNRYGPYKDIGGVFHDLPDPDYYRGHRPGDVLDDNPATYWMSFSHIKPRWPWGVEWIELQLPPSTIETIQMWTVASGYTCYISVYADGAWRNAKGLPAAPGDKAIHWSANPTNPRDQQATIPYVKQFVVGKNMAQGLTSVGLPVVMAKVTRVRLSFVNLQHLPGVAPRENFRVGVRNIRLNGPLAGTEVDMRKGPAGANPGRYSDYSDIVKLLCAWAGFFWPRGGFVRTCDGQVYQPRMTRADVNLGHGVEGRVWGDFEPVYTVGPAELGRQVFENKSCMDAISYLREMLGFIFYIDEVGAAQWRLPNIYEAGNWLQDERMNATRTVRATVIDEKQVLLGLDASVDSKSLREIIRVSNNTKTGTARGYIPNDVGLRRVLTWNEWRFEDADVQRAADMTAVRSLFTYRTDRVVIPGFPGVQLDDQIIISERTASESVRHYVSGISSNNNLENGEWTYTITTHWLGDSPDGVWAIKPKDYPESVIRKLTNAKVRPEFRNPNL